MHLAVIPEMEEFVERDIPVLLIQTDDPWKNKTSYIGTDDLELGKRVGVLMASQTAARGSGGSS